MTCDVDQAWMAEQWLRAIPPDRVTSICDWGKEHVRLIGSARSEQFDVELTPWLRTPIETAQHSGKTSLCKPVQSGGSTAGEVVICHALATRSSGDCGYFWPNDMSADGRWAKRFEKILLACKPVMSRVSPDRFKWTKGLVIFPHANFEMKGVHSERSVASDAFKTCVSEELHIVENGWEPGRLGQVYGRTTAHWASFVFNVSNAGFVNSDWHKAWRAGSQEHWQVKCPSCNQYHELRCRWEDAHPELGGLRYDATNCRLGNFEYDYNKLAPTIFYQMPCGFRFVDDITVRRSLSKSGRYSEPKNKGALPSERSFTYEAASVDFISFISIVQRKHQALKSMAIGDFKPWFDFLREVECRFVDIGRDRPQPERTVVVTSDRMKSRDGMSNRLFRLAVGDRQKGKASQGEAPHWWLLIQDWAANGDSLVVWEGRCDTEGEMAAVLNLHEVKPICVALDSSWDTTFVYSVCLRYGYNAFKAEDKMAWPWEDGTVRFYSEPRPLFMVANSPPCRPDDPCNEPDFWLFSKYTAMERLIFLRQSKTVKFEVPADVSNDFVEQFDSWSVELIRQKDGQTKMKWRQTRDDDHLFQNAATIIAMVDMADGFTGVGEFPSTTPVEAEEVPA